MDLYKDVLDALYAREGDAVPGNELVLPSSHHCFEEDSKLGKLSGKEDFGEPA